MAGTVLQMLKRAVATTAGVLLGLCLASGAQAQATRTWVSGVGDDANPCSRTAPCKTFAGAISKTAAGGEISVLDPGGFGAVTITKAMTISAEWGGEGGVLAANTNGVIVNASAGSAVTLRGLVIHGAGNGLDGIRFLAGGALHVENTLITAFTGDGIDASLAAAADLTVTNTNITECAGAGISLADSGGGLQAALQGVRIQRTGTALRAGARAKVSLRDADLTQNTTGILANAATARVFAEGSQITFNTTGVSSQAGAIVRISDNTVTGNTLGLEATGGGTIESFGNNRLVGNGSDGAPTTTLTLE